MAITSFSGEYRFLSNFYPSPIDMGRCGVFPTVEHVYQAAKTNDAEWRERIRVASSAREAKEIGRRAPLTDDWEFVKIDVMSDALAAKFLQNAALRSELLATGHQLLIEGNHWHDQFWGSCNCDRHAAIDGWNALGILLMKTRLRLHNQDHLDKKGARNVNTP